MSQRWSYKVVKITPGFMGLKPEDVEAQLNQFGLTGWELIAVTMAGMMSLAYLKKEMS